MLCYSVVQLGLCRSQWNGCVNVSRKVLVLQCCLAIALCFAKVTLGTSHWNCYIMDAVWDVHETLCFSGKRRLHCGEKLPRVRECAEGLGIVALAWDQSRYASAVYN